VRRFANVATAVEWMRTRRRSFLPTCARVGLMALLMGLMGSTVPAVGQVAVVTNPESPLQNLSLDELGRIYLGQTAMTGAGSVHLAEFGPLRDMFYGSVVGMAERQFVRHWIGVVFRGGSVDPPVLFADAQELCDFVRDEPGAIAFLPLPDVQDLKVLTIDGMNPSDDGYPIS